MSTSADVPGTTHRLWIRDAEPVSVRERRGIFGAGDRDRTDDIQLGKLTFYH